MNTREIKFRGLRTDGKGWIYGDYNYYSYENEHFITEFEGIESGQSLYVLRKVIPETVGQLSNNLTWLAGEEVYVGDIISFDLLEGLEQPYRRGLKQYVVSIEYTYTYYTNVKLIGNIHDKTESEVVR